MKTDANVRMATYSRSIKAALLRRLQAYGVTYRPSKTCLLVGNIRPLLVERFKHCHVTEMFYNMSDGLIVFVYGPRSEIALLFWELSQIGTARTAELEVRL
jgi:hypothetical protein